MIPVKEFKAALRSAIYLAEIKNEPKDMLYLLDHVVFDFGSSLDIIATCLYSIVKINFNDAEPGNGRIAMSIQNCNNMINILPNDGELLVTVAGDNLVICHGLIVSQYEGVSDFTYPEYIKIFNHIDDIPTGHRASLDFRYFNNTLKHLAPLIEYQQIEFFIKGDDKPFFVHGSNQNMEFDLVVMPYAN